MTKQVVEKLEEYRREVNKWRKRANRELEKKITLLIRFRTENTGTENNKNSVT